MRKSLKYLSIMLFIIGGLFMQNSVMAEEFLMPVEDIFDVTGKAVVVVGTVQKGNVRVNDTVKLVSSNSTMAKQVEAISLENGKDVDVANIGNKIGVLFLRTTKSDIIGTQYLKK